MWDYTAFNNHAFWVFPEFLNPLFSNACMTMSFISSKNVTMNKWFQFQLQQGGSLPPSPSCQYNHMNAAASYNRKKLSAAETKLGACLQKWTVLYQASALVTVVGIFTPKRKNRYIYVIILFVIKT